MQTPADLAFHERLARDLLRREGSGIVWRLHLDAIETYRDGHCRGAEFLIQTADAAERLLREAALPRVQSYRPTLAALNEVDADAITFETCSSGTGDLDIIGKTIAGKKVVIGVIDHHAFQIERADQPANLIHEALRHIPPERLVISSDCGMGREVMSRRVSVDPVHLDAYLDEQAFRFNDMMTAPGSARWYPRSPDGG